MTRAADPIAPVDMIADADGRRGVRSGPAAGMTVIDAGAVALRVGWRGRNFIVIVAAEAEADGDRY